MSSRSELLALAGGALLVGAAALLVAVGARASRGATGSASAAAAPIEALRVCADPNNLPFSNRTGEGFENHLAELVARELGRRVEYTWFPQRRGFIRNTLRKGECDVVMGVPSSFELALTTAPYYRSTYVFVYRKDSGLEVRSMDDPVLRRVRVGVPVVGDDYANTPGAAALARRGIIENVEGYSVYGDYDQPNPPARLIEAVARGDVDVAIAWGPLAGYFAQEQDVPLEIVPVSPQIDPPFTQFVFDIAMAVRRGDDSLRVRLEDVMRRRAPEIRSLLKDYAVPLVATGMERTAGLTQKEDMP